MVTLRMNDGITYLNLDTERLCFDFDVVYFSPAEEAYFSNYIG